MFAHVLVNQLDVYVHVLIYQRVQAWDWADQRDLYLLGRHNSYQVRAQATHDRFANDRQAALLCGHGHGNQDPLYANRRCPFWQIQSNAFDHVSGGIGDVEWHRLDKTGDARCKPYPLW